MKISVAAKQFGIPEPTLRAAILAGKIAVEVDAVTGVRVVRAEDVQAWVNDDAQHKPGKKSSG